MQECLRKRNPVNNAEGNPREGEIWVNLNKIQNDNSSQLQQTSKELRE